MQLDIYLIRGRGEAGDKFQLAMVKNNDDHYYKGEYDPTRHFGNLDELKEMLAEMVNVSTDALELNELRM